MHVCVWLFVCLHGCLYVDMCVWLYVCVYPLMCVCVVTYARMHLCMPLCMYGCWC